MAHKKKHGTGSIALSKDDLGEVVDGLKACREEFKERINACRTAYPGSDLEPIFEVCRKEALDLFRECIRGELQKIEAD